MTNSFLPEAQENIPNKIILFFNHKLHKKLLNIKNNYDEVYAFLERRGIKERGQITSPEREVWFETHHFLRFDSSQGSLYYTHQTSKQFLEGKPLRVIEFEEFKTYFEI